MIFIIITGISYSQADSGYYLTYGNPDGSPLVVPLDSDIEVRMWVQTPLNDDMNGDGIVDSVAFIINILASNDKPIFSVLLYGTVNRLFIYSSYFCFNSIGNGKSL